VVGQIGAGYILVDEPMAAWIVDQHVAHERALLDGLTDPEAERMPTVQSLLIPEVVELEPRDAAEAADSLEELSVYGFEVEPFGKASFRINGAISTLAERDVAGAFRQTVSVMKGTASGMSREERILATIACHSAVKLGDRLEAVYVLAVGTGMRQGDLLGLKWEDVDLEAGTVQVRRTLSTATGGGFSFGAPKTAKSRRSVKLPGAAISALKKHRRAQLEERMRLAGLFADHGLVFASRVGTPVSRQDLVTRSFKPLLRRAGLPDVRFHDLRHTCATLLLGRGVHAKLVQELLGHSTISVTLDTYSHVLPGMSDAAAGAMDEALG
jgi:hypothetical protein